MSEPLNNTLLLALILGLTICLWCWLICSCSDTYVRSDPLSSKTVCGLMAELDCFADYREGALEICTVATVELEGKRSD